MHTDNCRLAQGAEVTQNERKQTCLLSFHSCLPSMPAASSARSPLPGPLERPDRKGHRTLSIPCSRSAWRASLERLGCGSGMKRPLNGIDRTWMDAQKTDRFSLSALTASALRALASEGFEQGLSLSSQRAQLNSLRW
jgi:hypothetical protein